MGNIIGNATEWMEGLLLIVKLIGGGWGAALIWVVVRYVQDARLRDLLTELVLAAEGIYGPGRGADKRKYVLDKLEEKGRTVSAYALEATVFDQLNRE
jgi:hypothetical protein